MEAAAQSKYSKSWSTKAKKVEATETPIEPLKKKRAVVAGAFRLQNNNGELEADVTAKDMELLKQARTNARKQI